MKTCRVVFLILLKQVVNNYTYIFGQTRLKCGSLFLHAFHPCFLSTTLPQDLKHGDLTEDCVKRAGSEKEMRFDIGFSLLGNQ